MKTRLTIVIAVLLIGLVSFGCFVFSHSAYPEKAILGEWKEVSWTYDKVNENDKVKKEVLPEERVDIANHLVVHQFENWTFGENYRIKLHERGGSEHYANWKLKDRGRILQLTNPDGTHEVYSVETLNKKELVLHFDTDVHARGIVKITLRRK